jgi:CubicO group peptidase (beta-lactamase class C family)
MKKSLFYSSISVLIFFSAVAFYYYPQLAVATGYASKKMCTCSFVSGRDEDEIMRNDLYFSILSIVNTDINVKDSSVVSTIFGLAPNTAKYKNGLGCILLPDNKDDYNVAVAPFSKKDTIIELFATEKGMTKGIEKDRLMQAIDGAFDADGKLDDKRTTAILIIHKDTLIVEKYAPPFHKNMAQLGWSMTKSWMNTMAGIMVLQGKLKLDQNQLFEEWKGDVRKDITVQHLLQMNSGLAWDEDYTTVSDATKMLYKSEDVAYIPLSKQLVHPLGKFWYYSSGTSNLLSKLYRNILGDASYHSYLKQNFFLPLGMNSAFIETDETGTFIGSSYGYATPRDWAKFGLLYLHDGVIFGKRYLPEAWVNFSASEATGSQGKYGAQFWLNKRGSQYPDAPHDMLIADGFQGQYVFIIPSHQAVIVRMGTGGENFDVNAFIKEVLSAFPKE